MRSSFTFRVCFVLLFMTTLGLFAEKKDALLLWKTGKYNEAVEVCLYELDTLGDSQFSRKMDSYSVLGWSLLSLERYDDAIKYGMQAYNLSRGDYRIIEILGRANYFAGNLRKSLDFFEKYIEKVPSMERVTSIYYYMGDIFIRLGEYNRADVSLTVAVNRKPHIARWWARLGYAREMAREYHLAKEAYQKALSLNPSQVDAERGQYRVQKILSDNVG